MDENKNRAIIVVVIIVVIVLAILAYFLAGARGIASVFNFIKWGLIGVIVIGLAVWGAWFLFIRKIKDDRVALNAHKVAEQARLTKPETIGDLWLSGDIEHPQIRLGTITGYTRIINVLNENEDVFVFKKLGFPLNLFEEPKILRVNPETHSALIGDVIVAGIAMVAHGGFFYINYEHLNLEKIDRTIKTEIIRQYTMDVLRDIKIISDMAVSIDPQHIKSMESRSLLKIPSRTDPSMQQSQQGNYDSQGQH